MRRLMCVILSVMFLWTNCVWAGQHLAVSSDLTQALGKTRLVQLGADYHLALVGEGITDMDALGAHRDRISGYLREKGVQEVDSFRTIIFRGSDGGIAYYTFSPRGYFYRFTTLEQVDDPFKNPIQRIAQGPTTQVPVTRNEQTYYLEEFQISPQAADTVIAAINRFYPAADFPVLSFTARQSSDSRGKPTIEVTLRVGDIEVKGDVPAGASKGADEAQTVSVEQAIKNINEVIAPMLVASRLDLRRHGDLIKMEQMLIERAGANFNELGANATVPVSRALWKMAARLSGMELYEYIQRNEPEAVSDSADPVYFYMNIYNGGLHALKEGEELGRDRIDIQEIMIVPVGARTYQQALEMGDRIDRALKDILLVKYPPANIKRADEAGFSVKGLGNSTEAIGLVFEAIERAGYTPGVDVKLALDVAASSFLGEDGRYLFQGELRTSDWMIDYYKDLVTRYSGKIISIEDGLAEDDWAGWKKLTVEMKKLGIVTIGDDNFVTQLGRLERGIREESATSILIKVNQNGTMHGTLEVIKRAKAAGMTWVVSHRSGETLDDSIADLAYATKALGLKTGDPQPDYDFGPGGEYEGKALVRRAKYKRMVAIERASTQGSALVRKTDGEGDEAVIFSAGVNENGALIAGDMPRGKEDEIRKYMGDLASVLDRIIHIHGIGVITRVEEIQFVENLKGQGLYPQGRAPLASFDDGVLKIDTSLFKYGPWVVFNEVEHEFNESIAGTVPGSNEIYSDVVATYREVLRFLDPNEGVTDAKYNYNKDQYQEHVLSVLRSTENPLDPDGEYLALLERLKAAKGLTTNKIIASVVRYVLRTKLYERVREGLGLSAELAQRIRDIDAQTGDMLAVLNGIAGEGEGKALVAKAEERVDIAIRVIKAFNGIRTEGLGKLSKRLAGLISASVKVANKKDALSGLAIPQTDDRYCIVVDRDKIPESMRKDWDAEIEGLKSKTGNRINVVYSLAEAGEQGYKGRNIIHLLDPVDIKEEDQMAGDILYLPMPYLRSSLYMAAMVVITGGDVSRIDPMVKGLISELYGRILGGDVTDEDLANLFTAPWRILPRIKSVIGDLNNLSKVLAEIEKAA